MPEFSTTPPIPYVSIGTQAAAVRTAIDAARLSAANSFGGLQKLAIPGPYATDAEASTGGVPDDNLYYRSDGTVRAASHISLDLAFALDKTLTARTGPTPTFSRASSGLFVNANGILVGKTEGTTVSLDPTGTTVGTTEVTVAVASGSVVGWLVGQSVSLIVDSNANNAPDTGELWLVGDIVSTTATQLVFKVTSKGSTSASATAWTLGYRGARFDHDPATGVCKGLLIEESRTNYIVQSENFTSWWATSAGIVSRNKETSIPDPAGTFNSTRLEVNATFNLYRDPILSVPDGTRAVSIFARAVTGGLNSIALLGTGATVRINLATGAVITNTGTIAGSLKVERFGAIGADGFNWWRISYATTDTTGDGFYIENVGTVSGAITAFLIFGAQYEIGAFPTSYLPTTSGTAIRSADVCSIVGTDFSSFYNQSEGTLFADATPQTVDQGALVVGAATTTFQNGHFIYKTNGTVTANGKRWGATTTFGATPQSTIATTTDIAIAQSKLSYAYKLNDMAFAANGALIGTDNTGTMPTSTAFRIGARDDGAYLNGHIARIQYFRKRLSNAKLQTLTTP